jgi:hypothetical protein
MEKAHIKGSYKTLAIKSPEIESNNENDEGIGSTFRTIYFKRSEVGI